MDILEKQLVEAREKEKIQHLEKIADNSDKIVNELRRIGDILQSFPSYQTELGRAATALEKLERDSD